MSQVVGRNKEVEREEEGEKEGRCFFFPSPCAQSALFSSTGIQEVATRFKLARYFLGTSDVRHYVSSSLGCVFGAVLRFQVHG